MPATPSVEQLTEVSTTEEMIDFLIDKMRSAYEAAGIEVDLSALQENSAARADLWGSAAFHADRTRVTANIVRGQFLSTAKRDWLSAKAKSDFDEERNPATRTAGQLTFTPDATAGLPFSFQADELVIKHVASGQLYRNAASGSLTTAGSPVDVEVVAEIAGVDGNQVTGAFELVTPIPGVALAAGTDWITSAGADEETDGSLREKCRSKWATLSIAGGPRDAYIYWARTAHPAVTRVQIDDSDPTGTGQVGVYVAESTGVPQTTTVDAVSDYINGTTIPTFTPARYPIGANVTVSGATATPVSIVGQIYTEATYLTTVQASVTAAMDEFFANLPIGGAKIVADGFDGFVLLGELYRVALSVRGVVNMAFSTPTTDIPVAGGTVVVPTYTFSVLAV